MAGVIDRLLAKYQGDNYVIRLKARFLLQVCIASLFVIPAAIVYNAYLSLTKEVFGHAIYWPIMAPLIIIFFVYIGVIILIYNGRFSLGGHVYFLSSQCLVWSIMFVDKSGPVERLDTIIIIIAMLSMSPLIIRKHSRLIPVYSVVFILISAVFILLFSAEMNLSSVQMLDFFGDAAIASVVIAIMMYNVFSINRAALEQSEESRKKLAVANSDLAAANEELAATNEEFEANNEMLLVTNEELSEKMRELRQAEYEIKKSEERYRAIFEGTSTANVIVDEDTIIQKANHKFAQMVGYSKDEIEGKMSWTVFIASEDLEMVKNNQARRRTDPESVPSIYEIHAENRKKEPLTLMMSVALLPEAKVSVASLIDITEKRTLEAQLIQSQKMESVGRLAGGVAHDFNNMLSVIIGNAQLAMEQAEGGTPIHKALQDILDAGQRSADLTRQLLAFARRQTVSPRVLDLNETISGMLKMLQRLIGEDVALSWIPSPDLWRVRMDPSQVDQLLANLFVNARDAFDKAGRITIETANAFCDEVYCSKYPECAPGEYAIIAVSDNGCGMDRETLNSIFEPFFTTKKEGGGTGLGLSTVYGIARQNGGFVTVYSEPGEGSTFRVHLPRDASEPVEHAALSEEERIPGGTETVLIVEDEEAVLNLVKGVLERLGYTVLTARKAEDALNLAEEYPEQIDLLLTDIVMTDMNGSELSKRIGGIRPGIKCLFMSGYTSDIITHHGILEEGVNFISKPFTLRKLSDKIRELLGTG